jgi:hypothetical protein
LVRHDLPTAQAVDKYRLDDEFAAHAGHAKSLAGLLQQAASDGGDPELFGALNAPAPAAETSERALENARFCDCVRPIRQPTSGRDT